jgi:hypothetical protein
MIVPRSGTAAVAVLISARIDEGAGGDCERK